MSLDKAKATGFVIPTWQEALEAFISRRSDRNSLSLIIHLLSLVIVILLLYILKWFASCLMYVVV